MSDEQNKDTISQQSRVELAEGELDTVVGGETDPDDPTPAHLSGK